MLAPRSYVRRRSAPMPALHVHLFGHVPLDDLHNLQRRLAYEAASREDGRITVLACEHESIITIGRAGSRADVRMDDEELARRRLEVQHVARGGGSVLHGPGQLVLYVVAPIRRLQWTVGDYLRRLQAGVAAALDELLVNPERRGSQLALWGRKGLLVAFGVSVRHGVTQFGAAINVNPEPQLHRRVLCIPGDSRSTMRSLLSGRADAGRMSDVRSNLVVGLAAAFGCHDSYIFTGHPLLPDASLDRELPAAA